MATWLVLLAAVVSRRHLPFTVRVAVLLGVFYSGMTLGLTMVGPFFGPGLAGAVGVLISGLVLGRTAGLVSLGIGALTIVGVGGLVSAGLLPPPAAELRAMDTLGSWLREAIAFALFTGLLAVTLGYVVQRIETSLATASAALARIEAEQQGKRAAQAALVEAERAVSELQRLEALGRLGGGIAHDFNNALVVLMGGAEMLADADLDDEQRQVLDDMSRAIEGSAQLTAQLLAFGRRDVVAPRRLDPREIIEAMARSLDRVLPDDITLELEIRDPPTIVAGQEQIQHVLLNLAINARDAMPEGGTLTLAARADSDSGGAEGLVIEVRDTGHGMDPAVRDRVFEPFFTTKPQGEGTGLGLSTVFSIVQRIGGRVEIDSEPGRGTVVRIRLSTAETTAGLDLPAAPARRQTGARGTVLVVEDDDSVRRIMVGALSKEGFSVLEASSATEGVSRIEGHVGTIDLLCTDGVMPGGSTRDLIGAYRERFPDGPVLVCSGHVQEDLVRRDIAGGRVEFLPKPFQGGVLVARILAMLED